MYCLNCGKQIDENATHCPYCGIPIEKDFSQQNIPQQVAPRKGLVIAAKVFIIIGILICALYVVLSFVFSVMDFSETPLVWIFTLIIALIIFAPGIIFGSLALKQMSERKPSVGISVCVLIFCSGIGGILLLCTVDSDYIKT